MMKKFADILKFLHLSILAAVFCCAGIGEIRAESDLDRTLGATATIASIGHLAMAANVATAGVTNYYNNVQDARAEIYKDKVEISPEAQAILDKAKNAEKSWEYHLKNAGNAVLNTVVSNQHAGISTNVSGRRASFFMEQLRNAANGEYVYNTSENLFVNAYHLLQGREKQYANLDVLGVSVDSTIEDIAEKLRNAIERDLKEGIITSEEADILRAQGDQFIEIGRNRALQLAKAKGKTDEDLQQIVEGSNLAQEQLDGKCPTVDNIRAKYYAGCWSCLVVERLSSAFLTAASKAYGLSQKAGLILLGLGSVLWLLLWGLRNVSSLTQLEPGNILNELIKFGFKVALAYFFIILGLRMVGTYFINPIMGVGAKIAETYWDKEKIKPYTEEYDWELTDEQYEEINKVGVSVMPEQQEMAKPQLSEADKAKLDLANQKSENFAKTEIPNFIVPPVFEGWLTSPVGCRKHPVTGKYANHKGLDIGTQGKTGGKIVASGPGKIYYASQPNGAGNYAKIIHEKGWISLYFHMLPESMKLHPNGSTIAQGEVIGFVGTSGRSSGPHLHFEIKKGNRNVDPLYLLTKVVKYVDGDCNASTIATFPSGFKYHQYVPKSPATAWTAGGEGIVDLTAITTGVYTPQSFSSLTSYQIGNIKYSGPKDIMSEAVMNSIIGATKAITDITSENMILGDAIMCYATLDKGGAWHPISGLVITNFWMWTEGAFYWFTGMLLTLAIAYYLLDMSFKIGFAVVALPIVVGLWPFELTKDKFGVCISIIAKAAATYAFLAITTAFTVQLTDAVFSYETDEAEITDADTETGGPKGLAKLYSVFDRSALSERGAIQRTETQEKEDIEYASNKLAVFSTTFVLVLFAFLYSYKLIQKTVPDLVNKFFPDKAFGNQQPMHHWATAASKWVKDQAVKPLSLAADIAMYQGGGAIQGMVGKGVGAIKGAVSGKKDGDKDGQSAEKNDKQSGQKEKKDGGGK